MGLPLMGEGTAMLLCLLPAFYFHDGTVGPILISGLFTLLCGLMVWLSVPRQRTTLDLRIPFLLVSLLWIVLALFGTLPFLTTGTIRQFSAACFESMSGLTSTGATVFGVIEALPASVLLWRSLSQWVGGFGIVLLVLAVVPSLGINKYSLYTAEASGADNTGKSTAGIRDTVQRTMAIYVLLTVAGIVALWSSGMALWPAVNLTLTNISSGGFSIYSDSLASVPHRQQYILAIIMLFSGINFTLLYNFFTLRFSRLRNKMEQFGSYFGILLIAVLFTSGALHWQMGYGWSDALRLGLVQSSSVLTTTGSLVADTELWWRPVALFFVVLSFCGGMAGSTTGGLKVMRVIILLRNVRNQLRNRLHPHAVNPVRLNGQPVGESLVENVTVIFLVFLATFVAFAALLVLCGLQAIEAVGASVGCLTGYGPGLGRCGGLGNYGFFPPLAQWLLCIEMLMGRLECVTVIVLLLPGFWRKR